MNHLEQLKLKNFLCYEKATFNFHKGVNIIIGPTDHGKSALMDALLKLFENRPMGDEFQSWWNKNTMISLKLGSFMIKYKKKKTAMYQIKDIATGKIPPFNAIGRTVPDQITNLINMDRKINIQKQLEKKAPIFLLSESPGDVAKFLNGVANLGLIDTTLDAGKKDLKKSTTTKTQIDNQIAAKEKELLKFNKLDELKQLVIHAEKLEKRIDKFKMTIDRYTRKLAQINNKKIMLEIVTEKLAVVPIFNSAFKIAEQVEKDTEKLERIQDILDDIKDNEKNLVQTRERYKTKPLVKRSLALTMIIDQYQNDIDNLDDKLQEISENKGKLKKVKKDLKKKRSTFKKAFPDICPLCNSNVDKEKL